MKKQLILIVIIIGVFFAGGCKDEDNPIIPDPAPTFTVFSQGVELTGGAAGLQFFGRCTSDDINLIKVIIENPAAQSVTYNAGNELYVKDENFGLQDYGVGYYKLSGTWTFTFEGNKATGGKTSFSVKVTHSVAGKK